VLDLARLGLVREHTEEMGMRQAHTVVSERDEMTDVALRAAELVAESDFVARGIFGHVTDQSGLVLRRAIAIVAVGDPLCLDPMQRADATPIQPWPLVYVALELLEVDGPAALELARDVTFIGRPSSAIAARHRRGGRD